MKKHSTDILYDYSGPRFLSNRKQMSLRGQGNNDLSPVWNAVRLVLGSIGVVVAFYGLVTWFEILKAVFPG